jgi:hypothetical protein
MTVQDDRVLIENAEITDSEVVEYLSTIEPEVRCEALDHALQI